MPDAIGFPLTPAQQLFHAGLRLSGDAPIHNMGWRFDIKGPLDPERFCSAFNAVARRHDALGLRIVESAGAVFQHVSPPPDIDPPLDLRSSSDAAQDAVDWMDAQMAQPLDLSKTTWRSRLIQIGEENWIWFYCQNHIATDATSGQAHFQAVSDEYQGASPRPAGQFQTFALRSSGNAELQAHWASIGAGPFDMDAPYGKTGHVNSTAAEVVQLAFGQGRSERLDALAASPEFRSYSVNLSRFAILVSIHAAWICRVTGNRRICIGAPAHLRLTPEDRAAMGLFVETFPFRLTIAPGETFRSLFDQAMTEAKQWLRHAKPGASTPASAGSFNSIINYLPLDFGPFAGMDTEVGLLNSGALEPNHDHQLTIARFKGEGSPTDLRFRFKTAAYGSAARERAPKHWLSLADAMFADPDAPIEAVALGGDTLRGPLAPRHPSVLDAYRSCVQSAPDAIAISQGDRAMTYSEFDAAVSAFAQGCRAAGVETGDAVLVWATRSIETVAAIWGILRCGGVFVPFPADTPINRIRNVMDRHGIGAAIDSAQARSLEAIRLIRPAEPVADFPPVPREARAYVMFTSGSTGEPKGVCVDHHALAQFVGWHRQDYPGDHALATSLGFDSAITPLFTPLTSGRTVRVYPETGSPDLAVRDVIEEDCVDVAHMTPSQVRLTSDGTSTAQRLQILKVGGEALPRDVAVHAAAFSARGVAVGHQYGPTECVVAATLNWFDPQRDTGATVSIGRPAEGVEIAILDAGGSPVPVGLPGEIHIGGRLSSGYLDRPDLTAERFVTIDGRRMYRTGDLGRVEEDGRLTCLGRMDDQLKVSGVRIEPAEVAAALEALPGVDRAHVGTWKTPTDSAGTAAEDTRAELAAWVMGTGDPSDWRQKLRETLPKEMIPTRIALVSGFKLMPSGKVDQGALEAPPRVHIAIGYQAPSPGTEEILARLIGDELKLERVGALDNVYDLGIDSLAAIHISLKATDLGLALGAAEVFEHQTVRAMARAIANRPSNSASGRPDNPALAGQPLVALDPAQMAAIGRALRKG